MPSTTRFQDGLTQAILPETSLVFDQTSAWHTTHGVCEPEAKGRDRPLGGLLRWGEGSPRGPWLRWDPRAASARRALAPQLVSQTTAPGAGVACQSRQAVRIGLPCLGSTPAAQRTRRSDEPSGLERLACLLAAIVCLRSLGSGWAVARWLRTSRPTRGDRGTPGVRFAARMPAPASAVRAGRRSGWAKACVHPGWRRGIPGVACDWDRPKRCPCPA
jgi:hypothetical protein